MGISEIEKRGKGVEKLEKLGLQRENSGSSIGLNWSSLKGERRFSINPSTGETLAAVDMACISDYEAILKVAQQGFLQWRKVPAPERGECIRLIVQELRSKKEDLGHLISLESGKIKQEARG